MTIQEEIEDILNKEFSPTFLNVVNNSHLHKGHSGDDGSGNTHFLVEIDTYVFRKYNRLECHRMVYKSLSNIVNSRIHSLEVVIKKPT